MKVLVISPDTFGYHSKIGDALSSLGYDVNWLNHLYYSNKISKILSRIFPRIYRALIYKNFLKDILELGCQDIFVVIKGEGLSNNLISKIKKRFPYSKFVYYTWDSILNVNLDANFLEKFDSVKSFDGEDCIRNPNIELLPLFYADEFQSDKDAGRNKIDLYDFSFVGTLHSERLNFVKEVCSSVKNSRSYIYFYFPSKFVFIVKSLFSLRKGAYNTDVNFEPLSLISVVDVMKNSNAILDYSHPCQSGLTMRTIESLGLKKKIITTNRSVVDYDFYHPNNIYVYGLDSAPLSDFLNKEYYFLSEEIYKKYHINNWVKELINTN